MTNNTDKRPRSSHERLERCRWERPKNYFGADFSDYYVVGGRCRDSDFLEESNFHFIRLAFEPWENERVTREIDAWTIAKANHWAVGWTESIMVHKDGPPDLLDQAERILESMENYPVLDEDDLSQREVEETYNF